MILDPVFTQSSNPATLLAVLPVLAGHVEHEEDLMAALSRVVKLHGAYLSLIPICKTLIKDDRVETLETTCSFLASPQGLPEKDLKSFQQQMWEWLFSEDHSRPEMVEALHLKKKFLTPKMPYFDGVPNAGALLWWMKAFPKKAEEKISRDRWWAGECLRVIAKSYPEHMDAFLAALPAKEHDRVLAQAFFNAASDKDEYVLLLAYKAGEFNPWTVTAEALVGLLSLPAMKERIIRALKDEHPPVGYTALEQAGLEELQALKELGVPFDELRFEGGFTLAHVLAGTRTGGPASQVRALWLATHYPDLFEACVDGLNAYDMAREHDLELGRMLDEYRAHRTGQALENQTSASTTLARRARI